MMEALSYGIGALIFVNHHAINMKREIDMIAHSCGVRLRPG